MADQEVRSPNNAVKGHPRDSDRRGDGPQHGGPFVRSDSGHIGPHSAGKGWTPGVRRDTAVPVVGGPRRDVIE